MMINVSLLILFAGIWLACLFFGRKCPCMSGTYKAVDDENITGVSDLGHGLYAVYIDFETCLGRGKAKTGFSRRTFWPAVTAQSHGKSSLRVIDAGKDFCGYYVLLEGGAVLVQLLMKKGAGYDLQDMKTAGRYALRAECKNGLCFNPAEL